MNKKILELKNLVDTAEIALQQARDILLGLASDSGFVDEKIKTKTFKQHTVENSQIIEGVFDGEKMIGPDGKQYSVPANYASKSKLIEGDMLKLTILSDGTFVFKQIGPQERERLKGKLVYDNETDGFRIITDKGRSYRVLNASVTYFKGEPGDEAIILVPKGVECFWAAVENVVKKEVINEQSEAEVVDENKIPIEISNLSELKQNSENENKNNSNEGEGGQDILSRVMNYSQANQELEDISLPVISESSERLDSI